MARYFAANGGQDQRLRESCHFWSQRWEGPFRSSPLRRQLESGSGCWRSWATWRRWWLSLGLKLPKDWDATAIRSRKRCGWKLETMLFVFHPASFFWEVPTKSFLAGQPWCGQVSLQPSVKGYQVALLACQQVRSVWNTAVGGKIRAENPRSWEWNLQNGGCILQQWGWFLQNSEISPPKLWDDTFRSRSSLPVFRLVASRTLFPGETVGLGWPVGAEVGFLGEGSQPIAALFFVA